MTEETRDSKEELKYLISKCGLTAFVTYLYPELKEDINVSLKTLRLKHPEYNGESDEVMNTRLSKARRIFLLNLQREALQIIMFSKRMRNDVKDLAKKYYLEQL